MTNYIFLAASFLLPLSLSAQKMPKPTVSGKTAGHSYVDLGLPSGTLWATCNLGARKPTDFGSYFAWGETEQKEDYFWRSYAFGFKNLFKYCSHEEYGQVDNLSSLQPDDDAAAVLWGRGWQMPSREQLKELLERCDWEWTDNFAGTDVAGSLGISRANGRLIFLPAAGFYGNADLVHDGAQACYWSSSLADDDYGAHALFFLPADALWKPQSRYTGLPIRPVTHKRR